jgi:hypothetical protein
MPAKQGQSLLADSRGQSPFCSAFSLDLASCFVLTLQTVTVA